MDVEVDAAGLQKQAAYVKKFREQVANLALIQDAKHLAKTGERRTRERKKTKRKRSSNVPKSEGAGMGRSTDSSTVEMPISKRRRVSITNKTAIHRYRESQKLLLDLSMILSNPYYAHILLCCIVSRTRLFFAVNRKEMTQGRTFA